jgi:predicted RNA-binding protein with PIN domain
MALVRILVDGYSLLHNWAELAPGKPRHSAAARDELIRILTLYRDAIGTPITVFFDGSGPARGPSELTSTPDMEILFSRDGKTADDLIERAAHRFQPYGEVMAVTDDHAERDIVIGLGGTAASCFNFIQSIANVLDDQQRAIKQHNRRERNDFNRRF